MLAEVLLLLHLLEQRRLAIMMLANVSPDAQCTDRDEQGASRMFGVGRTYLKEGWPLV